jgi:Tfp pilus assembly protein PilV
VEKWSNEDSETPTLQHASTPSLAAFALYEVLIGVAIFAIGVLALGRAVENCMNASALNAEEERVRQILSNRMAEVQTTPGFPDASKEFKIDTGYGIVKLIQKSAPAGLEEENGAKLTGINLVTLTVQWMRAGVSQSKQVQFYVYRPGANL